MTITSVLHPGHAAAHGWHAATSKVSTLVHWRIHVDGAAHDEVRHTYPKQHYEFIESALLSREMDRL